jgi:hypothetical protein
VCAKKTGHAEVVAVYYDPAVVSFKELLEIFFTIHDPTTPNRYVAAALTSVMMASSATFLFSPVHQSLSCLALFTNLYCYVAERRGRGSGVCHSGDG